MFKQLALSLLLLQLTFGQCQKGCLRCQDKSATDSTKVCVLCDTLNNYYLKADGTCALTDLTNCQLLSHDNTCLTCAQDYRKDNGKCVAVTTKVENCQVYDSTSACVNCRQGYYLSASKCVAVTTSITNCLYYKNQTLCLVCSDNYVVSSDEKSCVKLPTQCLGYSPYDCKKCNAGYIQNLNLYETSLYNYANTTQRDALVALLFQHKQGISLIKNNTTCQKTDVLNCQQFSDFKTCTTCLSGHYLQNGACIKFPRPVISNCKIYIYTNVANSENDYSCQECNNGYHRESAYNCKANTTISNCQSFSTTSSATSCTRCIDSHVLSGNQCNARTTTLTDCATPTADAETCALCGTGKILNSNNTKCISAISNCKITGHSVSGDTATCNTCVDGYYPSTDATQCTAGTVTNCKIYNQSSQNQCSQCNDQYYPDGTCDQKHTDITDCTDYDSTNNKRCLSCANKKAPITYKKKCVSKGAAIANCLTYNFSGTAIQCSTCKDGYYLKTVTGTGTVTSCEALKTDCKTGDATTCNTCKADKVLVLSGADSQCVSPLTQITDNCASVTAGADISASSCATCADFYKNMTSKVTCASSTNAGYILKKRSSSYTLDNNCKYYGSNDTCLECIASQFLQSDDSTCDATCTGIKVPLKNNRWAQSTASQDNGFVSKNHCIVSANFAANQYTGYTLNASVETAAQNGTTTHEAKVFPIKCKDNKLPLWTSNGDWTNINPFKGVNDPLVTCRWKYYPSIKECADFTENSTNVNNGTKTTLQLTALSFPEIQFNKVTDASSDDYYIQLNCRQGQSGGIVKFQKTIGSTLTDIHYLSCATDSNLSSTDWHGLSPYWEKLITTYTCTDTNKIPVYAFLGSDKQALDFASYKVWKVIGNNDDQKHVVCWNVSTAASVKAALGSAEAVDQFVPLTNCAIGIRNLNQVLADDNNLGYASGTISDTNYVLGCLACKPGYFPNTTKVGESVRDCQLVANCDLTAAENIIMNGCGKCKANYTWEYVSGKKEHSVDNTKCIRIPSRLTNCMAFKKGTNYNDSGSTAEPDTLYGECMICDKGYSLNEDGFCYQRTISQCSSYNKHVAAISYNIQNFLYQDQFECKCGDNFHGFFDYSANKMCYQSTYFSSSNKTLKTLTTQTTTRTQGNYILNCIQYDHNTLCTKCDTNYILQTDRKKCVAVNSTNKTTNCERANNTGNGCDLCVTGYGLTTQGCTIGSVANCKNYDRDTASTNPTCLTCNDKFWLDNNTCKAGKIPKCLEYASQWLCSKCETDYMLIRDSGSSNGKYCIKQESNHGCSDGHFSWTGNFLELTCTACVNETSTTQDSVYTEQNSNNSTCTSINVVTECEEYDYSIFNVATTSGYPFACKKCSRDFYLSSIAHNWECVTRSNKDNNCKTYQTSSDRCQECNASYYLNSDNTGCVAYPTGTYGCTTYDNNLNCTECAEDHYLSSNACLKVPSDNLISNCYLYSNATTCKSCKPNYFLSSNTCTQTTVSNCAEFLTHDSCKVCNTSYKIKTVNSKNSCEKVSISNCNDIYVNAEAGVCSQCNQGYYVDNDKCTKGADIDNCVYLASSTTCGLCNKGYALSVDKKSCQLMAHETECIQGEVTSSYVCSVCQAGYSFVNGSCQKNSNASIDNGCFDEDDNKKCRFCISGWSMGTDGTCSNNNPPNTNTGNSAAIFKTIFALVFVYFF